MKLLNKQELKTFQVWVQKLKKEEEDEIRVWCTNNSKSMYVYYKQKILQEKTGVFSFGGTKE